VLERHLSEVAVVLEEYAASIFMINVEGLTSPLICHFGLKSLYVRLVVNAAGTTGCLEGLFIMILLRRQHKEVFFLGSEMTTLDDILWCIHIHARRIYEFLFVVCFLL
jgi:hypothetical protein